MEQNHVIIVITDLWRSMIQIIKLHIHYRDT